MSIGRRATGGGSAVLDALLGRQDVSLVPRRWAQAAHPRDRKSVRWWIAQSSITGIVLTILAALIGLSVSLSALYLETEDATLPGDYRERQGRTFWLSLAAFRALLGVDAFPRQVGNPIHEALAAGTALIGVVMPALIIGVVVVRILAIRIFEWRRYASLCLASELDGDFSERANDLRYPYLAVRWYKRLDNVSVTNLQADAYLRCRTVSRIDGSTLYRYQPLDVVGVDGVEAPQCRWPETFSAMPFTLWIPLRAPLDDRGRITVIQGRLLADTEDRELVVRLSGQIARPAGQLSEEHRYDLVDDVQVGRFVPVEPDLSRPAASWPGWRRFEERIVHAVFLYGTAMHPDRLLDLLGHWPGEGDVAQCSLVGFRWTWRMVDATAEPSSPGGKVLIWPTIQSEPGAQTPGLLVRLGADRLAALDGSHIGYDRIRVTTEIWPMPPGRLAPDVVWTYAASSPSIRAADTALAAGTARIDANYYARLRAALLAHEGLLEAFQDHDLTNGLPMQGSPPDAAESN
jgi:hypothetical protein